MIPGRLHNAAVTTVWRKRNEPGCRISNFPSPTFTRADGWCKKSNFPSLSFARADICCKILNFPSLFEREQIRKVRFLAQTQRKRGLSPVFAFGKFEILRQTRNPPAQKLPTHTRGAPLHCQNEGLVFAMRGSCSGSPPRRTLHRQHEGLASETRGDHPEGRRRNLLAGLHRQHGRPAFTMRGDRPESQRHGLLAGLHRQHEGLAFNDSDA